jgi:hypothetical protein
MDLRRLIFQVYKSRERVSHTVQITYIGRNIKPVADTLSNIVGGGGGGGACPEGFGGMSSGKVLKFGSRKWHL